MIYHLIQNKLPLKQINRTGLLAGHLSTTVAATGMGLLVDTGTGSVPGSQLFTSRITGNGSLPAPAGFVINSCSHNLPGTNYSARSAYLTRCIEPFKYYCPRNQSPASLNS